MSIEEKEKKKNSNRNRHLFLIEQYFDNKTEGYATKNVGNWVLVKQWNGGTNTWDVAIYTKERFGIARNAFQKSLLDKDD